MYDFRPDPALSKADLYRDLLSAADALTAGEPDGVANMANVAALLWDMLPQVNWTGFYRLIPGEGGGELVLGPVCRAARMHPHRAGARRVWHGGCDRPDPAGG